MHRRKNYFIKKKFQLNFLSGFILLLLLESLLLGGLFMHLSTDTLTTGYSNSVLKVERTSDFFFVSFLLSTLVAAVAMALVGMGVFIMLSHRLAGPLFRFESTLKDLENGDLTQRINLRKTDEIMALKESLNTLIESMDVRIGRIKKEITELHLLIAKKNAPASLEKIYSIIEQLENEIDHFKVSSDNFKE
ncbi:MAG: methyl-accepting chemotaxis protein [Candidatus Omnitrophota bacterium]|jgi:methyl-accepting chemotaxis protein